MIEYCPIPLPCSVSGIMQWPVILIPYPVPTYGCNKDTSVLLWRRAQAVFWTNTLLYKALWRRHSFKVLFKHQALEWLMHAAPIIVTTWGKELCHLYWKRSKRSTTRHEITPLCRVSAIVRSVWNSPGLGGSTWLKEDPGSQCRNGVLCSVELGLPHSHDLPHLWPHALETGCVCHFASICVFLWRYRFLHCEMLTLLSKLPCLFISSRR